MSAPCSLSGEDVLDEVAIPVHYVKYQNVQNITVSSRESCKHDAAVVGIKRSISNGGVAPRFMYSRPVEGQMYYSLSCGYTNATSML